ncbi:MAB_1171c family putative transporter [Nocardia sp. CA-129566]|uniref:MAB_1171c family putative transporter n=1 Tax=Nocardia sp. CA-129566 TaxID=3239976 RepID=UPI003D9891B3
MNSLPAAVMVAIGVFVAAITIGRWLLVNDTLSNRLINRALAWDLIGLLAFVAVGRLGSADLAFDLFAIFGALTVANVFGFARLLDGADMGTSARRQRTYDAIAAAAGCVVLVGTVATRMGLSVDWGSTVWLLSAMPTIWSGLLIIRACVRELRAAEATAKERLTYCALLVVGGYSAVASMIALVRTVHGTRPDQAGPAWAIGTYATLVLLTALIGIPLWNALLAQAGLDRAGRCCRRLRPLWRVLTAAVPEVVLESASQGTGGSASRLYRMTVEIHDALVQLKPFAPDAEAHADIREYARCIAQAAQAKADGRSAPVIATGRAAPLALSDHADELRYLLDLARAWPRR